jgi:carboxypeptidase C (cathepsin A)
MKADVEVIGQFVRRYVTRYGRWLSPKYIVGESYGTTRAVALAGHLQKDVGMLVEGLVLISSALDFQTLLFEEGNDLPYILFLPSYTATAWYHRKLPASLQKEPMEKVLAEAQRFANVEYRLALAMGDTLDEAQRERVVERLAYYTGLSKSYVRASNLRVPSAKFIHEILRDEGRVVGILDGRVTGLPAGRESFVTDPSLFVTLGPLVAALYQYVRSDLRYQTDRQYEFLNGEVSNQWSWGSAAGGFPSVLSTLRQAMSANTHLRVHMACGYFDLDTSYMSQRYAAEHLLLDESIRDHLEVMMYYGGHQLYTYVPALEGLTENVRAFVRWRR